jgi:hypothetical protein
MDYFLFWTLLPTSSKLVAVLISLMSVPKAVLLNFRYYSRSNGFKLGVSLTFKDEITEFLWSFGVKDI